MTTLSINQRWWRSDQRAIFAGVCEGLGEKFDLGPWMIRIVMILMFLLFGSGLILYIFAALSFPKRSKLHASYEKSLMGVCRNLARRLDMAPEIVRFSTLVLMLVSFGATVVIYFILAFTLPETEAY